MKRDWDGEAFEKFLAWLDPDREKAAEKLLLIRSRLVTVFISRGCGADAEELADETIDRVIRRAQNQEFAQEYEGPREPYFVKTAHHLFLEWKKRQEALIKIPPDPPPPDPPSLEAEYLEHCLKRLPRKSRRLVLAYFEEDKQAKIDNRRVIAKKIGITVNALRIRIHRITVELGKCIDECLANRHRP